MRRALVGITVGITTASVVSVCFTSVATASPSSGSRSSIAAKCNPVSTKPRFAGDVPSPTKVLGYHFGKRQATNQEIARYWKVADRASNRIRTGVYATSVQGRPLRYALVGTPGALRRLPKIQRDLSRLRDPATPAQQARALIRRTPTILWVAANVHGNEPSGADAVVRLLHEVADRSDCVGRAIRNNAVVGLIPVQNPDGRAHDTRYNAYAFDMNRDGLVGTQPEIAGRLKLLWKYPPQLFVDEHENSGRGYFFPPDADPIYHETPEGLYDEIEKLYGPANSRAFDAHDWRYETWQSGYDFFAQVYGDTVPTTQMGAVGMTFEQGDDSPYPVKVRHHYTSGLSSLFAGASHRADVLKAWRRTFVEAKAQGERCKLEPNRVYNPGSDLLLRVPKRKVCGYFLLGNSRETRLVVKRLQDARVEVKQLKRRTVVDDFRAYGEAPARTALPAGTYWVSLAQAQKHWVQAALNEDTYVPFPYFYDVSGWSLPQLAGVAGGSTGHPVTAPTVRVPSLRKPTGIRPPATPPRIAVLDQFKNTWNDYQNTGWLKWRLAEDWRLPYTVLQPKDITPARMRKFDVIVVGNVDSRPVYRRLGAAGRDALTQWVDRGGRYVGWQEGSLLAASLGISEVGMATPDAESPGALMRTLTPRGTTTIEWDSDYNLVLQPGDARVLGAFPDDMFVSGFADQADTLAGTALQTVERYGDGSVTVFGYEPNFRAIADDSAFLLRRAILRTPGGSLPWPKAGTKAQTTRPSDALRLAHGPAWRKAHEDGEAPSR